MKQSKAYGFDEQPLSLPERPFVRPPSGYAPHPERLSGRSQPSGASAIVSSYLGKLRISPIS
jgi:hypothetical protein